MDIVTNKIVVEKYNFETILEENGQIENKIELEVHEVEPIGGNVELMAKGKIFKITIPFVLALEKFRIDGRISRIVQVKDYFGQFSDLSIPDVEGLSNPLIDYIKRLTYDVTEIAFDEPGISLDFNANHKG
ncbi:DUF1149 family protein [Listeria ivanovii]|uniref:DUF1149 family protein n=2 Tax=Listeria ivanovii TaxID=1638 RepID=A0ABS1G916_LISIV|nr:DUF1149 family protein [Listeria ivanovii]EFR98139.1 conserved hypothetical protein [Listeria ivanovii FSL F6-596]AIS58847.1 hypothetical protein JL58_02120 [Listeria ivanovii subsp. londoniensis]AIS61652.1 hypothetical protein JL53_02435 [Listeria ivanovii subsp. londoniensis]MBK1963200.1 DUF1149 family protein [Listeria ivanovii subsp. londoniensis]MBK1965914.1 DUF1149 family protein [Listeria ivanovii subsp. londoniensis]